MFNLQANAYDISLGIREDLDMELSKIGMTVTSFAVSSFSYPEEVQKMQEKAASQSMIGDINKYTQVAMADGMGKGSAGGSVASDMVQMQMGMAMGQQMMNNMGMTNNMANAAPSAHAAGNGTAPKFCPECGTPTGGAKFCPECGTKLV